MEAYKEEFIDFMLDAGALKFGEFTLKSGRKSPFFINTGSYVSGSQLKKLGDFYAHAINEAFGLDFDILFGPAYKGIPLAAVTCCSIYELYGRDIRYSSNRKEVKDHGDTGIMLGARPSDGDRVVIIEDVTTSGLSIAETLPVLQAQAQIRVQGLMVSINREERALDSEEGALEHISSTCGFPTSSIVTMSEVISYLHGRQTNGEVVLNDSMKQKIEEYYSLYGSAKS